MRSIHVSAFQTRFDISRWDLSIATNFYNPLSINWGQHISDEDYTHAQLVFKDFGRWTLRDYHNLYLESDVALLENIFENLRDNFFENSQALSCTLFHILDPELS